MDTLNCGWLSRLILQSLRLDTASGVVVAKEAVGAAGKNVKADFFRFLLLLLLSRTVLSHAGPLHSRPAL